MWAEGGRERGREGVREEAGLWSPGAVCSWVVPQGTSPRSLSLSLLGEERRACVEAPPGNSADVSPSPCLFVVGLNDTAAIATQSPMLGSMVRPLYL